MSNGRNRLECRERKPRCVTSRIAPMTTKRIWAAAYFGGDVDHRRGIGIGRGYAAQGDGARTDHEAAELGKRQYIARRIPDGATPEKGRPAFGFAIRDQHEPGNGQDRENDDAEQTEKREPAPSERRDRRHDGSDPDVEHEIDEGYPAQTRSNNDRRSFHGWVTRQP